MKKLKILFEDKSLLIVYKDGNIPTINSENIVRVYITKFMITYIKRIKESL